MDQRWRTLRSESLLKDRWINLRADHCVTPSGIDVSPYYVLSYPDWVHVAAITEAGRLVLVRQYRHGARGVFLELPGGAVDAADACVEQAARRELEEETGFTASRWELVTSVYAMPGTHTNRVHVFLALDAECTHPQSLDPGEHEITVELSSINEVLRSLRSGSIGSALQISSILLALAAAGYLSLCVDE